MEPETPQSTPQQNAAEPGATTATPYTSDPSIVKPLRTYERDIADMIRAQQTSAVDINLAERRREEAQKDALERAAIERAKQAERVGLAERMNGAGVGNATVAGATIEEPLIRVPDPMRAQAQEQAPIQETIQTSTPSVGAIREMRVRDVAPMATPRAESRKIFTPQLQESTARFTRNTLLSILGVVLVVVGALIFVLLFFLNSGGAPSAGPTEQTLGTFIPSNQEKEFDLSTLSFIQVAERFSLLLKEKYPDDSITHVKILNRKTTQTEEVEPFVFWGLALPNAPSSLTRAFEKKMFAGIYTFEDKHPFFIVAIESFDNAFEGMLLWEKNLYKDMGSLLRTERAETTQAPALPSVPLEKFEDLIVANKDTRALRDNQGNIILIYSFIDEHTLLIVDSEITFKEILNRLNASRVVR